MKNHRPIILVLKNSVAFAMIELKTNMGWCRNSDDVVNKICINNNMFSSLYSLKCTFSKGTFPSKNIFYTNGVHLYLLCSQFKNCNEKSHSKNKEIAYKNKVTYMSLFDGNFDSLTTRDIISFGKSIIEDHSKLK